MSAVIVKPSYLSDRYWSDLSAADKALYIQIRPIPTAAYEVDVGLTFLPTWLRDQEESMPTMGGSFELDPDYQRGHVWTPEQRVAYIESFIRGQAPRTIMFNCPGWMRGDAKGDIPHHTFQCIDGLQRLTSLLMFIRGELAVFGDLTLAKLKGSPFDARRMGIKVCLYEFAWREELLDFYLRLNAGGTPHAEEELNRVRQLHANATPTKGIPQ